MLGLLVGPWGAHAEPPGRALSRPVQVSELGDATAVESRLAADVRYLASDELGGRGPFTEGLERAADHIAEQFRAAGLSTARFGDKPFQIFRSTQRVGLGDGNRLALQAAAAVPDAAVPDATSAPWQLEPLVDFTPLSLSAAGRFDLPLVFAGYGLHCPDDGLDDYANRDVTGHLAVVLRHAPPSAKEFHGPVSRVRQQNTLRLEQTFLARKAAVAANRGAAGLLLVTDSLHLPAPAKNGEDEPAPPVTPEPLLAFQVDGKLEKPGFFVLHCRRTAIDRLLRARGQPTLAELESELDERYRQGRAFKAGKAEGAAAVPMAAVPMATVPTAEAPLAGCRAAGEISLSRQTFALKNVLGELPGSGDLAGETVVLGAHYDHLGQGGAASLAPWTKATHNGADENASGTAALLELARQLAVRRNPLRCRRFLFVAFSAEEMGLVGSERFVGAPPIPLESVAAMLNLDMVGRLRSERLTISGVGTAREFEPLARRLATRHRFSPRLDPSGYGPSDHATFAARGIPVLHFFTGLHEDYHRPSDDFERIELTGLRRIVELVAELALELGHAERRPTPTGESLADLLGTANASRSKSNRPADQATAGRVGSTDAASLTAPPTKARRGLGIVIAELADSGVVIQRVQPGSVAEQAGLRAGDRILGVANVNVVSGAQLLDSLKGHRSPAKETFRVQRGGTVLEIDATW
ncbi:MAG: M28 family peptidase [Planctomycetota bacterium]